MGGATAGGAPARYRFASRTACPHHRRVELDPMERYGSSALATSSTSASTLPSMVPRSPVPAWQSADFSALAQPMVNLAVAFWRHAGSTVTPFAAALM